MVTVQLRAMPGIVRFGRFALDVRSGELRKDGLRVRLSEQRVRQGHAPQGQPPRAGEAMESPGLCGGCTECRSLESAPVPIRRAREISFVDPATAADPRSPPPAGPGWMSSGLPAASSTSSSGPARS